MQSGENGEFSFASLPLGPFQLTISAPGFITQTVSGVLRPGEAYIVPPVTLAFAKTLTEVQVGATQEEIAEAQIKQQEKQRLLGIIPNFYVSYVPNAAPLTPKQKFQLAWKSSIDPVTFLGVGALAGIEQAADEYGAYGQGAAGYARRFGAAYGDVFIGTFLDSAALPILLSKIRAISTRVRVTIRSRLLHALSNAVIRKGDNGHWQPSYSGILGSFAACATPYTYYPAADRGGALLVGDALLGIAGDGLGGAFSRNSCCANLLPIIRRPSRRIKHHRNEDSDSMMIFLEVVSPRRDVGIRGAAMEFSASSQHLGVRMRSATFILKTSPQPRLTWSGTPSIPALPWCWSSTAPCSSPTAGSQMPDPALVTTHRVTVDHLVPYNPKTGDGTYYIFVASADAKGNLSTAPGPRTADGKNPPIEMRTAPPANAGPPSFQIYTRGPNEVFAYDMYFRVPPVLTAGPYGNLYIQNQRGYNNSSDGVVKYLGTEGKGNPESISVHFSCAWANNTGLDREEQTFDRKKNMGVCDKNANANVRDLTIRLRTSPNTVPESMKWRLRWRPMGNSARARTTSRCGPRPRRPRRRT